MHTGLSKPFRHINMPLYHLKNPVDLELMADKIIQSCTGDQSLYIVDAFQQICLPAAIQLRKNIIQQKNRCIPDFFLHQIDLRKLQGKGRSPLLPLGTIPPDVDPVDLYAEIISVCPTEVSFIRRSRSRFLESLSSNSAAVTLGSYRISSSSIPPVRPL